MLLGGLGNLQIQVRRLGLGADRELWDSFRDYGIFYVCPYLIMVRFN